MRYVTRKRRIANLEHLIKGLQIEIGYYRSQRDRWRELAKAADDKNSHK